MSEPRWREVARATGLLGPNGRVAATIFAEMTALATRTGALNLGQGFPDADGPAFLTEAAAAALRRGPNQYPPGPGLPELREAVALHQERHYGLAVSPEDVLVTVGATEAIASAVLALAGPGDEVLTLEPFYDSYAATIALAGATHRTLPLRPTPEGFRLEPAEVAAAFGDRTRVLLLNSPHNPTGTVLTREELGLLAEAARRHDVVVVTDEVYEHLTYGAAHIPIATLPGMAERTLTVSSAGKTFSLTGWKVGWLHGPAELVTAARTVKQFLTYVGPGALQHAVAVALRDENGEAAAFVADLREDLRRRRDLLVGALTAAGLAPVVPAGTYFVLADAAALDEEAARLCRELPERIGVVAIPVTAFCAPGGETARSLRSWVRFTFVKSDDVLTRAAAALRRLGPGAPAG